MTPAHVLATLLAAGGPLAVAPARPVDRHLPWPALALPRWATPAVAFAVAAAVGLDRTAILWAARAPRVADIFQGVVVSSSLVALAALALCAALDCPAAPNGPAAAIVRLAGAAAALLLLAILLGAAIAPAPLLSLARLADLAIGLLAYDAIARRPRLARWLVLGLLGVALAQLPLAFRQQATHSTYPYGSVLYPYGGEIAAAAPGAAVAIAPDGTRWQRALGSFPHPNLLGGFLALILLLALTRLPFRLFPPQELAGLGPPASSGAAPNQYLRPLTRHPLRGYPVSQPPTASPPSGRGDRTRPASAATLRRLDIHHLLLVPWTVGWLVLGLTYSRTALLAAALGCGCYALSRWPYPLERPRLARLTAGALVGLLAAVALSGPLLLAWIAPRAALLAEPSAVQRVVLDRAALDLALAHPLLGVGAGNFSLTLTAPPFDVVIADPAHAIPLLVAAESGIPAGLAWLALLCALPFARSRSADRPAALARAAVLVTLLPLALLDHYLWTLPTGRALLWIALGVVAAADAPAEEPA